MSELSTLARPYADAVFQLAREAGNLDRWLAALERLAAAAVDPQLHEAAGDPRISAAQMAGVLVAAAADDSLPGLEPLLALVVENQRVDTLPEVVNQFRVLKNAHEGTADATVETAFALDEPALASLRASLERRLGLRLNIHVTVDPSLIGGVRVTVGDRVLDASVRSRLDAMRSALLNSH